MTQLNEKNVTVPNMSAENKTLTQITKEKSSNETVKNSEREIQRSKHS